MGRFKTLNPDRVQVWVLYVPAFHTAPLPLPPNGLIYCQMGSRCNGLPCDLAGAQEPGAYDSHSLSLLAKSARFVSVGSCETPIELELVEKVATYLDHGLGNALMVHATDRTAPAWRDYLRSEAKSAQFLGPGS